MTKIIQFKQQEENCECEDCLLVSAYIDEIADSESEDELFIKLRAIVAEAKLLGVTEYIEDEINAKQELYNHLTHDFTCGYCDCEDGCELED